jgi:hypothetical protein
MVEHPNHNLKTRGLNLGCGTGREKIAKKVI